MTKSELQQGKEQQGGADSPSVHINLQIHVSSDATPDQIGQDIRKYGDTHISKRVI